MERIKARSDQGWAATHSLAESYAVLTRLPGASQAPPSVAWQLLSENVIQNFSLITLSAKEYSKTLEDAATRGIQGGKIYDALLLAAAIKSGVERIYTFNVAHFQSIAAPEYKSASLPPDSIRHFAVARLNGMRHVFPPFLETAYEYYTQAQTAGKTSAALNQLEQLEKIYPHRRGYGRLRPHQGIRARRRDDQSHRLILKAAQKPEYQPLVARVIADGKKASLSGDDIFRSLLVAFGMEILKIVPGPGLDGNQPENLLRYGRR